MLVILLIGGTGCRRDPRYDNPDEVFRHVRSEFLTGHLIQAQQEAEKAHSHFASRKPEWAVKFQLLTAEILLNRGLSQDTLALLAGLPSDLNAQDLLLKKNTLQALALMALGRVDEAQQRLQDLQQLCHDCQSDLAPEILAAQGIFEVRRGHASEGEKIFRSELQVSRSLNQKFAEAAALLNLSFAAVHQRHYDEALDWSNSAYRLAHSIDAGLTEEKALGNSGWVYYRMGDSDRSLSLSLEAEKMARELGIVKDQLRWLNNAGLVYDDTNQFLLARQYYEKALELAKQIEDPEQVTNALVALSTVSFDLQKFDLAKQYSQEAFELAHRQGRRSEELYSLLTKGQVAASEKQFARAKEIFREIIKDPETESYLLWQVQNELARLYRQQDQLGLAAEQYQHALRTLECIRGSIEVEEHRLSFLTLASQTYDDYLSLLLQRGNTGAALQVAEYSRGQTLSEGLGLLQKQKNCGSWSTPTTDAQKIAGMTRSVVLFYWLGHGRSYLWTVTPKRTVLAKLPPATEIEEIVKRYRKALLDPPDVLQTRNSDGIKLYEMLVAPAKKFILPRSQVTIIADGSLNNLNFETLLVPDPAPHYWIEDVTVTNASSLRLLAVLNTTSQSKGRNLLLIGDPVVPDPKFPPLPNAKTEMENVGKHFSPALEDVSSGTDATPAEYFKSKPETFSYIHFVAHGTASQLSPLDSAVILSKSTADEDSYKLHARDIVGHRLRADLVVISACYGSGTTLYNGEGLVGLSWAFVRAGAHNVIGALWQVNDTSTPRLMDQMYSEIQKGKSPQEALRTAKLSLLHSDNSFRKPIYWAPFQFYTGS